MSNDALCQMRDAMTERMLATHEAGTWAPIEHHGTETDLALMGLHSKGPPVPPLCHAHAGSMAHVYGSPGT